MKKTFTLLLSICTISWAIAQVQSPKDDTSVTSLSKRLNLVEKKTDKFNLYFNFQGSFDTYRDAADETTSYFRASNLRLEMSGNLTDKLFYRLRHRLNKSNEGSTRDNLAGATDIFYAGYHFNDKFSFIFGKQCQYWGGFEYDLNPIYIYEFSDYGNNLDCFMLGATFIYNIDKNNELAFQVTDSRADKFENFYGDVSNQDIEKSSFPLTYIVNWNGNLFDNKIKTRWAVGLQTDAKGKYTYTVATGTMLNLPKFQLAFDYMMDNSDLDRLGIVTADMHAASNSNIVAENVNYHSFIAKAEYQPTQKWNMFLKGIYETADGNNFARKSYGYFAGVEYIPFEDQEMRLFLAYVGRKVTYSEIPLSKFDTDKVSLGLIYRIKAF